MIESVQITILTKLIWIGNLCHLFQEWHKEQSCCDNNHDDTQDSEEEEENIKEGCLISKDIFYLVPFSKK